MTGAEAAVRALEAAGVEYLFGLPGSTEAPLLDALAAGAGFRYLLALHESVAVGMADGYGRASGRPGVASLHTSVGTANALGAIYNAWRDASPVVVTAGHKDTRLANRDGFCTVPDLAGLPRAFTKWSGESRAADQIAADLHRALRIAATPPCGPTFLALPEELLAAEAGGPAGTAPAPAGEGAARAWAPP
ncbi:MAG TPA: thiamine pyrophosphate-binding protein, partial [Thermodesulfobacteriota bacterium]|nr:thiamine pyrophosphate-binding protein [Thermodesulfobacteriota bacterium]